MGTIATMVARSTPGLLLGIFVIAGTVTAALAVRPSAGRTIVPVPALAYLMAALISGVVFNRSAASSKAALAIGAAQWIADGFFAMVLATVLAVVITVVRWFLWRRSRPAARDRAWAVPAATPARPVTGQVAPAGATAPRGQWAPRPSALQSPAQWRRGGPRRPGAPPHPGGTVPPDRAAHRGGAVRPRPDPDLACPEAAHREAVHREAAYPEAAYPEAAYPEAAYPEAAYPEAAYPEAAYPEAARPARGPGRGPRPRARSPTTSRAGRSGAPGA